MARSQTPTESSRRDAGGEAWELFTRLMGEDRGRFIATITEFGLWPSQYFALQQLDEPTPMGKLAGPLHCDSSNVTGITDRLEERGLVERRTDERDRRVKLLVLTDEGRRLRDQISARLAVPPEAIARLPAADKRTLRDILRRAVAS
jgi:DNA-binding MarR family transcriptional regulator